MRKILSLIVITVLIVLSACQNSKPGISRLWFYTYSSDSSLEKNTLTPANFLELRPDKSFTSDLGKFKSGRWHVKDQQLFLNADDGQGDIAFINSLKSNEMQLKIGHSSAANFDALDIPKIENDPFSRPNNNWRIPASSKETHEQIKKRLENHCGFWVSYFTWALNNEMSTVDVRSTPSPIKIYGNGFTIKPYGDLPENWKGYFYDSADCAKASELLEDVVRKHTIAWAHTDNKYKMFISAFQQMKQFLR